MLQRSDRLRVLCTILDLDMEEFARRLADKRGVGVEGLQDVVRNWWSHQHQPTKYAGAIRAVLEDAATRAGRVLDIKDLWHGEYTSYEFANQCGLSIDQAAAVMSDVCRRSCFEALDRFPFLRLMRNEASSRSRYVQSTIEKTAGTYFLYRVHSSERLLCREVVSVEPQSTGLAWTAHYRQYAEHNRERQIPLSILLGEACLHAISAYRDEKEDGQVQVSMVHATIDISPYKEKLFAGILLDVSDNKTTVAAQRVLLLRASSSQREDVDVRPLRSFRSARMRRYRKFLKDEEIEDMFQLTADPNRIARMLESHLTEDDLMP